MAFQNEEKLREKIIRLESYLEGYGIPLDKTKSPGDDYFPRRDNKWCGPKINIKEMIATRRENSVD